MSMRSTTRFAVIGVLLWACSAAAQFKGDQKPPILQEVGLDQRLNNQVPLDARFFNEQGNEVALGEYFRGGKPVLLALVYYQCPMLCNQVLNGMTSMLTALQLEPGRDFQIVTISIDPNDTTATAAAKKQAVLGRYKRASAQEGWHFLTGKKPQIDAVANAVGYRYRYDGPSQQYFHPAAIMVLTPQGRVAQYFYGVEFPSQDVRLALVQGSQEKIGSLTDHVLLFCYRYDLSQGRYTLAIMRMVRIGGAVTLGGLGLLLAVLIRKGNGEEAPAR
jgi:protein SCO1/2